MVSMLSTTGGLYPNVLCAGHGDQAKLSLATGPEVNATSILVLWPGYCCVGTRCLQFCVLVLLILVVQERCALGGDLVWVSENVNMLHGLGL